MQCSWLYLQVTPSSLVTQMLHDFSPWFTCSNTLVRFSPVPYTWCNTKYPKIACSIDLKTNTFTNPVFLKRCKSGLVLKIHKLACLENGLSSRRWHTKDCPSFSVYFSYLSQATIQFWALMRNQAWLLSALVMTVRTRDGRCPLPLMCLFIFVWAVSSELAKDRLIVIEWLTVYDCLYLCFCVCLIHCNCLTVWFVGCGVDVREEVWLIEGLGWLACQI